LVDEVGFFLARELFWHNPAKLPVPAQWVTVTRQRLKDAVEYVFWFGKTERPKASNRNVLTPYSKYMKRLLVKGYRAKERPSGHKITKKWKRDLGGAIPSTTGQIAESLDRKWIALEIERDYLEGSKFRFWPIVNSKKKEASDKKQLTLFK